MARGRQILGRQLQGAEQLRARVQALGRLVGEGGERAMQLVELRLERARLGGEGRAREGPPVGALLKGEVAERRRVVPLAGGGAAPASRVGGGVAAAGGGVAIVGGGGIVGSGWISTSDQCGCLGGCCLGGCGSA